MLTGYFTETEHAPGAGHRKTSLTGPATVDPGRHHRRPRVGRLLRAAHRRGRLRRVPARRRLGHPRCSASRWPAPACSPRSASSSRWTPSARSPTTRRASPRCPATSTRQGARILTDLDAVGNTTKAITKGIAIATAVLAATALFGSFTDSVKTAVARHRRRARRQHPQPAVHRRPERLGPEEPGRPDHRRVGGVPVLRPGDQRRLPRGRRDRVRGAPPVPRDPGDHGRHRASRSTARSSTSAPGTRCASWRPRVCSPSSRRSPSASASASARSAPTWPARSPPAP